MATWAATVTTWTTETATWNSFPTDYLYTGGVVSVFGATSAVSIVAAVAGAVVAVFGAASTASFGNETSYVGSGTIVFSLALSDVDILTWTPRDTITNTWVEEAAL